MRKRRQAVLIGLRCVQVGVCCVGTKNGHQITYLGVSRTGLKSGLCHQLAVGPRTSYFHTVGLSFLVCKIGMLPFLQVVVRMELK